MATETVKLTGGPHDGRWQKVPRGATSCDVRGTEYVKGAFGRWSPAGDAPTVEADAPVEADMPKPAPRKRKPKPATE